MAATMLDEATAAAQRPAIAATPEGAVVAQTSKEQALSRLRDLSIGYIQENPSAMHPLAEREWETILEQAEKMPPAPVPARRRSQP